MNLKRGFDHRNSMIKPSFRNSGLMTYFATDLKYSRTVLA